MNGILNRKKDLTTSSLLYILVFNISIPAHAATSYAGLSFGHFDYKGADYSDFSTRHLGAGEFDEGGGKFSGDSSAYSLYVGYQFTKNIAVEAGYSRVSDLSDSYDPDSRLLPDVFDPPYSDRRHNLEEITLDKYFASVLGLYPISDSFEVFASAGYVYLKQERELSGGITGSLTETPRFQLAQTHKEDEEGWIAGLGMKYSFNDMLKARLQWQLEKPGPLDIKSTMVSIEVHF